MRNGIPVPVSRYLLFFIIAMVGCTADLLTKQFVFVWRGWPGEQPVWWLIDGYVGVETALNRGAVFGIGAGLGLFFAVTSIAAAVGILVWLFVFHAARDRWLTVALSLVTGGIFGNLYDRLGVWYDPQRIPPEFRHAVRDWILLRHGQYTWPNFNIADSMLVVGAALLMLHAWLRREPTSSRPPS